jgi:ABC-2 type transport system ATP-binding protein
MIIFKNVTKKFASFKALDDINFTIKKGEIVGLLGPNGAGKTTTMRLLLGLLEPTKGNIKVGRQQVKKENLVDIKQKIGYLPEENPLYPNLKVFEYLHFIGGVKNISEIEAEIEKVISACSLKKVVSRKIDHLSKGYKQRVGLAAALLGDPEILVLDEPTVGLDPNQIAEIRSLIKNLAKEKTVIFSSHILSEVQAVCEKVIIIDKGKVVESGNLTELTKEKSLEAIFRGLTK